MTFLILSMTKMPTAISFLTDFLSYPHTGRNSPAYTVSSHHFSLQRYEEAVQHQ